LLVRKKARHALWKHNDTLWTQNARYPVRIGIFGAGYMRIRSWCETKPEAIILA
jgi:hypothetical protein